MLYIPLSAHLREARAGVGVGALGTALGDGGDDQLVLGLGEGPVGSQSLTRVDLLVDDEGHAIHAVGAGGAVRLGAVQPAGFIVGDLKLVDVWSKLAVSRDEV